MSQQILFASHHASLKKVENAIIPEGIRTLSDVKANAFLEAVDRAQVGQNGSIAYRSRCPRQSLLWKQESWWLETEGLKRLGHPR